MQCRITKLFSFALLALVGIIAVILGGQAQKSSGAYSPIIPRTWEDSALASWHLPLAETRDLPSHISADYYYQIPERQTYKSYPVYAPGKEPPGYLEWLRQQEPSLAFDTSKLKTMQDWIRAGEIVFEAPFEYPNMEFDSYYKDATWHQAVAMPIARDGTIPFYHFVIREKGKVELGTNSCANCHTRVLPNGTVVKGAQGNFPRSPSRAYVTRKVLGKNSPQFLTTAIRFNLRQDMAAPWLKDDPNAATDRLTLDEIISELESMPPGVMPCHNASFFFPAQTPDLIGIKHRRYFDHTGHMLHRDIGDLMRFAAFVQGETIERFGDYKVLKSLPSPASRIRYSDAQLYALALYIYSLEAPRNPNRPNAFTERGRKVFMREGCAVCHTPPFYTNNKLTPVNGFTPPEEHLKKYGILSISVGTDANLALKTRKGTGYYKVPSLKGVWYRGPFEHNGSVATLEDWFDPRRLRDDYVPTGFKGVGAKTRAVRGHEFGLKLSAEDKRALIAFLKTL